jgi:hypothetical protein
VCEGVLRADTHPIYTFTPEFYSEDVISARGPTLPYQKCDSEPLKVVFRLIGVFLQADPGLLADSSTPQLAKPPAPAPTFVTKMLDIYDILPLQIFPGFPILGGMRTNSPGRHRHGGWQ